MSLARAFTFAGVRSTVMSLWKAPDAQIERLMILFYQNLKEGMAKDLALQRAKLTLIQKSTNPELGHPFFWAGCILNGNTMPLSLPSTGTSYGLLCGLLMLVCVLLVLIFRH